MPEDRSQQPTNGVADDGPVVTESPAARNATAQKQEGPRFPRSKAGTYYASIYPGPDTEVPKELAEPALELEKLLGKPMWLVVQPMRAKGRYASLNDHVRDKFFGVRNELVQCKGSSLLIDSPGGLARQTFQIATMFRRHCGSYVSVVPRFAKSGGTLLSLGGDDVYMGKDSELGPLDAQVKDYEREEQSSALDEVQAIERLHGVALDQFDQTLMVLAIRTKKKISTLLPHALKFTSDSMTPLLDKIDTVHYTNQSRSLKVAEEYATRLLTPRYGEHRASSIARRLVNEYPAHDFVIDREEAAEFLDLPDIPDDQMDCLDRLEAYLTGNDMVLLGRIREKHDGGDGNGA